MLLQSEEELMAKRTSELVSDGVASKPKKTIGKMKVQGMETQHWLFSPTVYENYLYPHLHSYHYQNIDLHCHCCMQRNAKMIVLT